MKYKDPITGELKDIYVKASDTLPVGSVVDYDGEDIPAGWEQVEEDDVALIESGSNENGNWTKFFDGTLICTGSTDYIDVPNNSIVDVIIPFAMPFNKVDSVIVSSTSASNAYEMGGFSMSAPKGLITNNNFAMRFFNRDCGDRAPTATYLAIGKWK